MMILAPLIPAKAGIQGGEDKSLCLLGKNLGPRFRGDERRKKIVLQPQLIML